MSANDCGKLKLGLVIVLVLGSAAAGGAVLQCGGAAAGRRAVSDRRSADVAEAVAKVLADIKAEDKDLLAVSEEDGRFLRVMAASSRATRALEIGGAYGYSAIWIGLGLAGSGGTLTTIEDDTTRAAAARRNIERAGLSSTIRVVAGDAFTEIPKLPGELDFVFLDAWKRDYLRFFELVFPRLKPGGLFLAHNVVNKASEMRPFLAAIEQNPNALTSIVKPSGEGMSVTLKIRP